MNGFWNKVDIHVQRHQINWKYGRWRMGKSAVPRWKIYANDPLRNFSICFFVVREKWKRLAYLCSLYIVYWGTKPNMFIVLFYDDRLQRNHRWLLCYREIHINTEHNNCFYGNIDFLFWIARNASIAFNSYCTICPILRINYYAYILQIDFIRRIFVLPLHKHRFKPHEI